MRHIAQALTLTAALCAIGCGSDDNNFSYGPFPNPTTTPIINPPSAVADSFTTLGNSVLTGSVTANDTLNGATVTAFQNPSNSGGSVAITSSGALTYTPPLNSANANDTFTYTLTNGAGSSTATVTVQIGARGFFVKNDAPGGGTGTQNNPFNTLAAAVTAAIGVNGAQIVVFRGNGTSTGQSTAVTLGSNQAILAQDPANPPTISGPITLATNNTLANLRLVGATGDAVTGTGIVGGTLQNVTIANSTVNGISLTNPTGIFTLTGLTFANNGRAGFTLAGSSGSLNVTASNWTATNTVGNATEANLTGNAVVNASFDQISFSQLGATNPNLANSGSGFWWQLFNNSNVTLRVSNYRQDTGGIGIDFETLDNSVSALVVSNANVTNGIDHGIFTSSGGTSNFKARITNSRLLGNFRAVSMGSATNAQVGARINGNTGDNYRLIASNASVFQVENLTNFATENAGSLATVGAIMNAALNSLGIPN